MLTICHFMNKKCSRGQVLTWAVISIAIALAVIALLPKKNQEKNIDSSPITTPTTTQTPTKSMTDIQKSLKELNDSSSNIDKELDDKQININE